MQTPVAYIALYPVFLGHIIVTAFNFTYFTLIFIAHVASVRVIGISLNRHLSADAFCLVYTFLFWEHCYFLPPFLHWIRSRDRANIVKGGPAWGWFLACNDGKDPLDSVPERETRSELFILVYAISSCKRRISDIEKIFFRYLSWTTWICSIEFKSRIGNFLPYLLLALCLALCKVCSYAPRPGDIVPRCA
jgi:hypothetical protein